MSEPAKQQMGDGQDNFGQAAGKAAQAASKLQKRLPSKLQPKVQKQQRMPLQTQ